MTRPPSPGLPKPRSAGANTAVMVVGHVVSRALLMLAFMAAARTLGPAAFGHINVALGVLAFLSLAVDPGLHYVAQRRLAAQPHEAGGLVIQMNRLRGALAVFAIVVTAAAALLWHTQPLWLTLVYAVSLLPTAWSLAWAYGASERFFVVALSNVVSALIYTVWVFVIVKGPQHLLWVPVGLVLANASATLVQHLAAPRAWRNKTGSPGQPLALVREGLPFGIVLLLAQLLVWMDSFLLLALLDASAVGVYHAAYRWILFAVGLAAYFPQVLFPRLIRLGGGREGNTLMENATRLTLALGFCCTLAFFGFSNVFIASAFGPTYAAAQAVLRVLCLLIPFAMHNALAVHCLNARHKERVSIRITVGALVANLLLNVALIPRFGAWGAAWALVLTEGTIAVFCSLALAREGASFAGTYRSVMFSAVPALAVLAAAQWDPAWRTAVASGVFVLLLLAFGDARPGRVKQLYAYFNQ